MFSNSHAYRRDIISLVILVWLTAMIIAFCMYKGKYTPPCTGHSTVHNRKTGQVTVMDKNGAIICIYFEPVKINQDAEN